MLSVDGSDDVGEVVGVAKGSSGVWMLMAAAADPKLTRVWVDGTPHSFSSSFDGPIHARLFDAVIPGFLRHWDLADLVLSTKWNGLKTMYIGTSVRFRMIRLNGGRSRSVPVRADLDRGLDESTAATGNRVFARGEQGPP